MKVCLAENIRMLRKERGLTQEQLAEAMGITVGTVSKWETGSCVPDVSLMMELAEFLRPAWMCFWGMSSRAWPWRTGWSGSRTCA